MSQKSTRLVLGAIVLGGMITVGAPAAQAEVPCSGVNVSPATNLQAAIDSAPKATTFCLAPGQYRLAQALVPKPNDSFIGQDGTVIEGSKVINDFTSPSPGLWVASGQTQQSEPAGVCRGGSTACTFNEDVFMDGQRLQRVMTSGELSSGEFYFDYGADKISIKDDPAGHLIEGAVARDAFKAPVMGVTLDHLTIQEFANPAGVGGAITSGQNWTIQNSVVRLNHGRGVYVVGGVHVVNNLITGNGQLGIGGTGVDVYGVGNEIANNNALGFVSSWAAGGFKLGHSFDAVIRDNYVHDNGGNGIWTDVDSENPMIEGNRVENNAYQGIQLEKTWNGTVRNNVVVGNGFGRGGGGGYGAGIMVSSTGGTGETGANIIDISGNTVTNNHNGITLSQQDRGSGPHGVRLVKNVIVRGNTVTMNEGVTGAFSKDPATFTSRNNHFIDNTYFMNATKTRWWSWQGASNTRQEWQAFGNDVTGSFFGS